MTDKEFDDWYSFFYLSFSGKSTEKLERKSIYKDMLGQLDYDKLSYVMKWYAKNKPGFAPEPGKLYLKYVDLQKEYRLKRKKEEERARYYDTPPMSGERMRELRKEFELEHGPIGGSQ